MIFINGFVEVKLLGLYLLVVFSEEGIYIGVDIVVGKLKVNEDKVVGGYCVRNLCVLGNMFYLEIVLIIRVILIIFGFGFDFFLFFCFNFKRKDWFLVVLVEDFYFFFL